MKLTKRINIIILIIIFNFFTIICTVKKVSAYDAIADYNSATWTVTSEEVNNVYGVTYSHAYGTTTTATQSSEGTQMINAFSMKTDGVNSKLVSWVIQRSADTYARSGLSAIAEDYEKNHPGWIVVAGINGDQYYATYGSGITEDGSFYYYNQPYYPLTIDNENRFALSPIGELPYFVGITNDGSSDSLIAGERVAGIRLEVIDDNNNTLYSFIVNKVNDYATDNEIAVWFPYNSQTTSGEVVTQNVSSSNTLYVVENAELAYMSNSRFYDIGSKNDALFGRGYISTVTSNYEVGRYQFAVETANEEVKSYLNEGTKIRVEYYYATEALNNVESTFGYHAVQRLNDTDITATAPYDTRRYNRSIFGKTADGTYVLLTVAKGNYSGTTQDESNAILKYYGVTEAYQQDGGGSVTAIIRNSNGGFDIVNESSDSSVKERTILMGCFFVVRDPEYVIYGKDSTRDSILISKSSNYNSDVITNVVAHINGVDYPLTGDSLRIGGLEDDTTYEVLLTYDVVENDTIVHASTTLTGTTASFDIPQSGISVTKTDGTYICLSQNTYNYLYKNISITINDQTYNNLDFTNEVKITNLSRNTSYNIYIEYDVYDDYKETYVHANQTLQTKTQSYVTPYIESFVINKTTSSTIEVSYKIIDEDNVISFYCIVDNNDTSICYLPDTLEGTYLFTDLDLKNNEYNLVLRLDYASKTMYSDTLTTTIVTDTNKKKCGKKTAEMIIQLLSVSSLIYILMKKK